MRADERARIAQIAILRHVGRHPHIVSLHDVLYLEDETIMLTDLVQGGELFDFIVDMVTVARPCLNVVVWGLNRCAEPGLYLGGGRQSPAA